MTYFIVPIILIIIILWIIYIAIKEAPPIIIGGIILVLPFFAYLDLVTYKTIENQKVENYSVLCDNHVCIIRVNETNITFETKKNYDLIQSGNFTIVKDLDMDIFGNTNSVQYRLISN